MSRILLIGNTPPPLLVGQKVEAAHYRTWQFLEPLLDDGHEVMLCSPEKATGSAASVSAQPLTHKVIQFGSRWWMRTLQKAHDELQPQCVIAVNFPSCLYATRLQTDVPLWMDIYGDMVTIQQAGCYRIGSDRGMTTTVGFLRRILRRGDVFSVCGQPQEHMLVGELAMAGRLNRKTFGYEFVRVVLPGSMRSSEGSGVSGNGDWRSDRRIAPEDFVVLWCGGYNTWTDVDTLFDGLAWVMQRNNRVHFVSVGASTYDRPGNMYERFLERINASPLKERFHMLGWRPWNEISRYYRYSSVGLNVDAMHYETVYGTRTRLSEMIGAGLPVITTRGSELSSLLEKLGAAVTFSIGDSQRLGESILELAGADDGREALAERARRCAETEFSFTETTSGVRSWVADPHRAPDRKSPNSWEVSDVGHRLRAVARNLIWQVSGVDK